MIILLSPAKTLNFDLSQEQAFSQPRLLDQSEKLVAVLQKKSARKIRELMSVSENIAQLNVERYKNFQTPFTIDNSKQAILAFKGDVYLGLEAETFDENEMAFAQSHIRILSGLYGLLKPLDLMQPYRLEMGTRLKVRTKDNLYGFWDKKITELINADAAEAGSDLILNLASQEYFSAVKPKLLKGKLVNVHFKENRNGVLKVISFNAKKARGKMTQLIVKNKITQPNYIKGLNVDEYRMDDTLSTETDWVFVK